MEKSERLASLIADLTTDGHIQLKKSSGVISFYSKDYSEIEKFNSNFNYLFNKKGNIFKDDRGGNIRYKLFIADTKLAKLLKTFGAPAGNKTNEIFQIPDWIMTGTKDIQKAYLQRIFDGEGSIFQCKSGRWHLTFTMNKNEKIVDNGILFFNEVISLLRQFNIDTCNIWIHSDKIRKDGSISKNLKLEIKRPSFLNFYQNINFSNPAKKNKLEDAIKSN